MRHKALSMYIHIYICIYLYECTEKYVQRIYEHGYMQQIYEYKYVQSSMIDAKLYKNTKYECT